MAYQFSRLGLKTFCNPLGVVYNPISIAQQIDRVAYNRPFIASDVIEKEGLAFHWDTSHKMATTDTNTFLDQTHRTITEAHQFLKSTDWVIVTLASAWVYREKTENKIVANCHKVDPENFDKILLKIDDIQQALDKISSSIHRINPQAQIIWTVSPVRYIRDGLQENTLSKSLIFSALRNFIADDFSNYFPSYEILMDCLRDYRFFDRDLVHPSDEAVRIIFDHLLSQWIDEKDVSLLKKLNKYALWKNHQQLSAKEEIPKKILNLKEEIKQALPEWV